MVSNSLHLPNGYVINVAPAFNGFSFKVAEKFHTATTFPPGWTTVLQTRKNKQQSNLVVPLKVAEKKKKEEEEEEEEEEEFAFEGANAPPGSPLHLKHPLTGPSASDDVTEYRPFRGPTYDDDYLFISSILFPSSSEKANNLSPARHIAMMLYATLWWYFHQKEPETYLNTPECQKTPLEGRPRGEWRVHIKQEGVFLKRTIQKLERMGLVSYENPIIGLGEDDSPSGCFVSRRAFWQIDPRIFLFPIIPPSASESSRGRSESPVSIDSATQGSKRLSSPIFRKQIIDPFNSHSRMPTYYPPPPQQYTFTDGVKHPRRQKVAHQGETVYIRYVPSVKQILSFRIPILAAREEQRSQQVQEVVASTSDTDTSFYFPEDNCASDVDYLHRWMNIPRVDRFWGSAGARHVQEALLTKQLTSRHSFPLLGCWDGQPFGYFEVYWVKEDKLGKLIGGSVDDYDRGLHCLVGEEEFRGPHRVLLWLTALVHYCFISNSRTQAVYLEPRVDNAK
ncbi:hypothetical protein KEM54_000323 [Ascosphaera aggregata]|nr:hypothetical protein KEM54_000323 [Ascosphaera aggregata]